MAICWWLSLLKAMLKYVKQVLYMIVHFVSEILWRIFNVVVERQIKAHWRFYIFPI